MMTTTLRTPETGKLNGRRAQTPAAESVKTRPATPRRNRSRIGIGVLVIVLSVLGVVALVGRGAERQSVLVLTGDVPAGMVIEATDLDSIELPLDTGLATLTTAEASNVVGQVAAVSLVRGTLLTDAHLAAEARVPEGMALLGAVLDPGQYPVGLREGDSVLLVETSPSGTAGIDREPVALGEAEVREIAEPPTGGSALVVSLLVPAESAKSVSVAGAQGRISLVVVGSR